MASPQDLVLWEKTGDIKLLLGGASVVRHCHPLSYQANNGGHSNNHPDEMSRE